MTRFAGNPLWYRWLIVAGGSAMLIAVAVELVAVVGRLLALPLPGSIELVQVVVTVSGAAGLVVATLHGSHAHVRLLLERLPAPRMQQVLRVNRLLAALFFLLLAAGSVWLTLDLWSGFEETEVWRFPYRPLRILVTLGSLAVAAGFVRASLRSEP
jgi:TRAP-type C4-dicarboxylate transport system permease small subunit